jgi:hypothetical protein
MQHSKPQLRHQWGAIDNISWADDPVILWTCFFL